MCPLCGTPQGKPCEVHELSNGRIQCACGKHSWPNSGAFQETCRRENLTIVGMVHDWTQSH